MQVFQNSHWQVSKILLKLGSLPLTRDITSGQSFTKQIVTCSSSLPSLHPSTQDSLTKPQAKSLKRNTHTRLSSIIKILITP